MAKPVYSYVRTRKAKTFIRFHAHKVYEFVYFFGGKGVINYNGASIPFGRGTYYVMESNVLHEEIYEQTSTSLVVQFVPPYDILRFDSVVLNDADLNISHLCEQIREEHKTRVFGYEIVIDSLMRQILTMISRIMHMKTGVSDNGLQDSILYVDQYFMTDIRVDDLAKDCGYSSDHYRFLFKQATGVAPKQYILNKRISLAKKLLKGKDLSISEISVRCGFESYSQFMTFFKKKTGLTPNKYRATHGLS